MKGNEGVLLKSATRARQVEELAGLTRRAAIRGPLPSDQPGLLMILRLVEVRRIRAGNLFFREFLYLKIMWLGSKPNMIASIY
jgi:hypothetical protein